MKQKVGLIFPKDVSNKPVVCRMSQRYDLTYNILRAKVDVGMVGKMIMEIEGSQEVTTAALGYLRENGITVILMPEAAYIDHKKCVECGACTAVCPTGALSMSIKGELVLKNELCLLCGACPPACPMRAITTQEDLAFD